MPGGCSEKHRPNDFEGMTLGWQEVLMARSQECAHESCGCMVPEDGEFGKYCSAHCREAKDLIELRCDCGHDACRTDALRMPKDDV